MHKLIACTLVFLAVLGCAGTAGAGDPSTARSNHSSRLVEYGNGLYYFNETSADFGKALSGFLKNHQCAQNFSMAPDGTGFDGFTVGYFVVCR